ncbi:MAG: acyl carrier protein [Blastocatellia bacterium]|nr:acyl carrier protein [Blastocatellia bacterium]
MNKSLDSIEKEVYRIVADVLKIDIALLEPETDLIDTFQADSLDALEIVLTTQKVFGFEVDDSQIPMLRTPKQIIECIADALKIENQHTVSI